MEPNNVDVISSNKSGKKSGSVFVVDPNPPGMENIPPEDLFIYVKFSAFPRSRATFGGNNLEGDPIIFDSGIEGEVHFISTSISYKDGKLDPPLQKTYATTDWTEIGGFKKEDTRSSGILEGFGINSINIKYNASLVPVVDIQFTDVRGSSLFDVVKDNDRKSPYSIFFKLPYPVFRLSVKGYYGQKVDYCLHMTNWTSQFDGSTGNFVINANFLGFQQALLNDLVIGNIIGAVNTQAGINNLNRIFDERIEEVGAENSVPLIDNNGGNIRKLDDFFTRIAKIQLESEIIKTENEKFQILKDLNGKLSLLESIQDFIGTPIKKETNSNSQGETETVTDSTNYLELPNQTNFITQPSSTIRDNQLTKDNNYVDIRDYVVFNSVNRNEFKNYIKALNNIINQYSVYVAKSKKLPNKSKKLQKPNNTVAEAQEIANNKISGNISPDNKETNSDQKLIDSFFNIEDDNNWESFIVIKKDEKPEKIIFSEVLNSFVSKDNSLYLKNDYIETSEKNSLFQVDLLKNKIDNGDYYSPNTKLNPETTVLVADFRKQRELLEKTKKDLEKDIKVLREEVENEINDELIRNFETKFEFKPTISKCFEIIANNAQAMIETVYDISYEASQKNIANNRNNILKNYETDVPQGIDISAFPSVYNRSTDGTLEEIYIGDVSTIDENYFPEYKFTEDVFEILSSKTVEIEQVTTATNLRVGLDSDNWFPINPIDYETNPWIKLNNIGTKEEILEELAEKFFIRIGILENYSNFDNTTGLPNLSDYSRLDSIAANKTIFDKNVRSFVTNILNEIDQDINILTNTNYFKNNINNVGLNYNWVNDKILPSIDSVNLSTDFNDNVEYVLFDKIEILQNSKQLFKKIREDSAYSKLLDNKASNGVNTSDIITENKFYKNLYENNNNLYTYNAYNVWDSKVALKLVKSNNDKITDNLNNGKLTDFNPSGDTYPLGSEFINITQLNPSFSQSLNETQVASENNTNQDSNIPTTDNLFENSMVESDLYNSQNNTYSKALLLLSTFPFRTFQESFLDTVFTDNKFVGARVVNLPITYVSYIGGLLWRYKQATKNNVDPLVSGVINNKNYDIGAPFDYLNVGYNRKVNPNQITSLESNLLKLPNSVSNKFISFFKTWVDINFQKFEEQIKIYVPTTENSEVFSNLKPVAENYFLGILKKTTDMIILNPKVFNNNFEVNILNETQLISENNTNQSSNLSLLNTKFSVTVTGIKTYIETFKQKFTEVEQDNQKIDEKQRKQREKRNKEIKLGIYNYFKNINNKWVGSEEKSFNICGGADTKNLIDYFRFIDRGWRCIGDEATFNLNSFLSLSNDFDTSVYVFMAKLLRDSNFLFQILPTYINFKSATEVAKIFQPQTTLQNNESTGPIFCCIYIGGTSEVLDIEERGNYYFKDDSFTFKGGNELPTDFFDAGGNCSNIQEDSSLVAFRVSFGAQNQNVFKNVSLNQQEHKETGEYFKALADLVDKRGATQQTYVGTDLLRIFKTRSYTCSVEALGCMNIQPLMYFDLQNVPFFNGAYLITNVTHSISPNHMTTNFQGVRQSKFISPPNKKIIADLDINLNEISEIPELVFTNLSSNDQRYSIGVLNPDEDFNFADNFGIGENADPNVGVTNFRKLGVTTSTFSDDELKDFLNTLKIEMQQSGIKSNSQVTMFLTAMLDNSNNFQNKEIDWDVENPVSKYVRFPETDENFPNGARYYGLVPINSVNENSVQISLNETQLIGSNETNDSSNIEVEYVDPPLTSQPIFGVGSSDDIAYSLDTTPSLAEYEFNNSIEREKTKIQLLIDNSENETEKRVLKKQLEKLNKLESNLYNDTKYFNIFEGDAYRFKPRGYLFIIGRKQYYKYNKIYGNDPSLTSLDSTAALSTSIYMWKNFKGLGDNLKNTSFELSSIKNNGSATIFESCLDVIYQTHSIGNKENAFGKFEKVLTTFITKSEPKQPLIDYFNPGPT
jgi:hypothetical protein